MDKFTKRGIKRYTRELRNQDGYMIHKRLNLYIDVGSSCNADCGFCIAKTRNQLHRSRNIQCMLENAKRVSKYCHSVEFVGGEPLVYINNGLRELFEQVESCEKKIISTNGLRNVFLENLDFLAGFEHINISRHGISNEENERILRDSHVLKIDDIAELPDVIKSKTRLNVTCCDNGISTAEQMSEFVDTFSTLGINQFMFANLTNIPLGIYTEDVETFTRLYRLSSSVFDAFFGVLRKKGYSMVRDICGYGYRTRIMNNGVVSIVLKENDDTYSEQVLDYMFKKNMILELILTPSGKVYTDWFFKNEFVGGV